MPGHQEPDTPVWMYPSEQMFYNAMKRKGWSPSEQDMKQVVAIHNGVNERAWSEVSCLLGCQQSSNGSTRNGQARTAQFAEAKAQACVALNDKCIPSFGMLF